MRRRIITNRIGKGNTRKTTLGMKKSKLPDEFEEK
jgi:hypothetical protein